ncbi:hypothetical protein BH09MYX1_BH09MYX1_67110 [soil metagenome]
MRTKRLFGWGVIASVSLIAVAASTHDATAADPKPKAGASAPAAPAVTVSKTAAVDLRSGDPAKVQAALDDVRLAGKGAAALASVINEILAKGLTAPLTIAAIDTLGDLEVESSSAVIVTYLEHRNPKIRQAAVKALVHTKGAAAIRGLRRGLADQDPMVRGVSASGLGTLKAKDALPDLFLALDHRVNEAASSIGMLCGPPECDQLAGKLGRLPFDVMAGGFEQVLFRPTTEMNDDAKIKIVGRLRELGTPEANKFLRDVSKKLGTASPRLKQSLEQAIAATGGGT